MTDETRRSVHGAHSAARRSAARAAAAFVAASVCAGLLCRSATGHAHCCITTTTTQGFGADFVGLDHEKTGCALYLHERWTKVPVADDDDDDAREAAPTKLAIGVAGGFNTEGPRTETVKEHALVLMPGREAVPLPCADLPELVIGAVDAVIVSSSVRQHAACSGAQHVVAVALAYAYAIACLLDCLLV